MLGFSVAIVIIIVIIELAEGELDDLRARPILQLPPLLIFLFFHTISPLLPPLFVIFHLIFKLLAVVAVLDFSVATVAIIVIIELALSAVAITECVTATVVFVVIFDPVTHPLLILL